MGRLRRTAASTLAAGALLGAGISVAGPPVVASAGRLVTGADIKNGSLTSQDLRDDTVRSEDVRDGSITSEDLAPSVRAGASRGARGEQGPAGEPGAPGERGLAGERGLTGERGPAGERGLTGERGLAGERGLTGERGPAGERGLTGERGPAGASSSEVVRWSYDFVENGQQHLTLTSGDQLPADSAVRVLRISGPLGTSSCALGRQQVSAGDVILSEGDGSTSEFVVTRASDQLGWLLACAQPDGRPRAVPTHTGTVLLEVTHLDLTPDRTMR